MSNLLDEIKKYIDEPHHDCCDNRCDDDKNTASFYLGWCVGRITRLEAAHETITRTILHHSESKEMIYGMFQHLKDISKKALAEVEKEK